MNKQSWQKVKQLFTRSLELETSQREKFLSDNTIGEDDIYQQVKQMLDMDSHQNSAITQSVATNIKNLVSEQFAIQQGDRLGAYEIMSLIGEGGMGAVYLAHRIDDEFIQNVAIKVIHETAVNTETLQRFQNERQILANLNHPNIARLLDGGTTDKGLPFLVMEYVEGQPILDYCKSVKANINLRIKLFLQVCSAVKYAHQNLIVHRDIKPGNILVSAEGQIQLLDFGIAKILEPDTFSQPVSETRSEMRMLTPENASPEQVLGQAITTRTDVYSLGNLLFQLLTEKNLFDLQKESRLAIERLICEQIPEKPSTVISSSFSLFEHKPKQENTPPFAALKEIRNTLKGDLDTIILKALQKDPERRYQSVEQLVEDIVRYLKSYPILARPDSFAYRSGKFIRRNKFSVATTSLLFVSIIAFIVMMIVQSNTIQLQKERAVYEAENSKQIADFMIDIFESSDPNENAGTIPSANDLLDRGKAKIDDLQQYPRLQATMLQTMGRVYQKMSDYELALSMIEQAMELRTSHPDTSEHEFANIYADLADLHFELGDYDKANDFYRKSLLLLQRLKLQNKDELTSTQAGLATVLSYQGKLEEAEKLDREVLTTQLAKYGENSIEAGDAYTNLGHVLRDMGKFEEADGVLTSGLKAMRASRGNMHLDTAFGLNQLARNKLLIGKHEEALPLAREGLEIRRQIHKTDNPEIAASLGNLSSILLELKRFEEAEKARRESLRILQNLFGEKHGYVAGTWTSLGQLLYKKGDTQAASEAFHQSLKTHRTLSASEGHRTAFPLTGLGQIALDNRDYQQAMDYLNEAYKLRKEGLNADNWRIASTGRILAETLIALNQHALAEPYLLEAYSIYLSAFDEDDARVLSTKKLLFELYQSLNKSLEANKYRS